MTTEDATKMDYVPLLLYVTLIDGNMWPIYN